MKFEEFKKLVKKRQELKKLICEYDYMYMKTEDMQALTKAEKCREELKPIELKLNESSTEKIEGSYDEKYELDIRLARCLTVSKEKVIKAIQEHFQNDKLIFFYTPEHGDSKLVMFGQEYFVKGREYLHLDALADITESYGGFKRVLADYPELEEVLWKVVEEQLKSPKVEEEKTLIQKMLEKQNELDFLQDEEAIQKRIEELENEKAEEKKKLEHVWQTYEEIKF